MATSKEIKESAFRACSLSEEDLVLLLEIFTAQYVECMKQNKSQEERHQIFLGIEEVSVLVLLKSMGKDPISIIQHLNYIDKAVNLITPKDN